MSNAHANGLGRLPNLIIVGVSKAGTTSLFNYLSQHPDICPSDTKELRYFSPLRYGQPTGELAAYSAHFSRCGAQRYAMEATPGYFYGGAAVARGIRETCPSPRALVSLREPSARCWSWFQFVKSRTRIPKDMTFGAYLDRCEELREQGVDGSLENQPFWGLGGGCYAEWLDDWTAGFADLFRIVFFDDVVGDPVLSVKSICGWLDIDSSVVDQFDLAIENKTEQYQSRTLQRAAVAVNRRSEAFFHRHRTIKRALRAGYYAVNKAPADATMSAPDKARLADFYRPYNDRLAACLARVGLRMPQSWIPAG